MLRLGSEGCLRGCWTARRGSWWPLATSAASPRRWIGFSPTLRLADKWERPGLRVRARYPAEDGGGDVRVSFNALVYVWDGEIEDEEEMEDDDQMDEEDE